MAVQNQDSFNAAMTRTNDFLDRYNKFDLVPNGHGSFYIQISERKPGTTTYFSTSAGSEGRCYASGPTTLLHDEISLSRFIERKKGLPGLNIIGLKRWEKALADLRKNNTLVAEQPDSRLAL